MHAATTIDLAGVPAPAAIEPIAFETLNDAFLDRFSAAWAAARVVDPTLPDYDVRAIETDPVVIVSQAFAYVRLLDRARVNDAVRAVLAPLATGTDLDNIAANANVARLTVIPATDTASAVMESDTQLLRRYLLAFDRPSAGSADRYRYEVFSLYPAMQDVAVIGRAVHGRRGDIDIVLAGPGGRDVTDDEIAAVRAAVSMPNVKAEATSISVLRAVRLTFQVDLRLDIPPGPSSDVIEQAAIARITVAAVLRLVIGAEVPAAAMIGAAYGQNILRVQDLGGLADIAGDPYAVPVLSAVTVASQVRS